MIWLVILRAGLVVGSIGPTNISMDVCMDFAAEKQQENHEMIATGIGLDGTVIPVDVLETFSELSFTCVDQPIRPVIGRPL